MTVESSTRPADDNDPLRGLTAEEAKFTMDFRKIEFESREKGIKFFVCIGDEPTT